MPRSDWNRYYTEARERSTLPDSYYEGILNNPLVRDRREREERARKDKDRQALLAAGTVLAASDPFAKGVKAVFGEGGIMSGLFGSTSKKPSAPEIVGAERVITGGSGTGGGFGGGAEVASTAAETAPAAAEPFTLFGGNPLAAVAAIIAGAHTGTQLVEGVKKALSGDNLSWQEQAALALPTFGASFLVNPINKAFGSGKSEDQKNRDAVRTMLQERGVLDENYNVTLADGSTFDVGKDGKGQTFTVDFNRQFADTAAAAGGLIAGAVLGSDPSKQKLNDAFGGYFANAALSNAGDNLAVLQNASAIMKSAKLTPEVIRSVLDERLRRGIITDEIYQAQINTLEAIKQAGDSGDKGIKGAFTTQQQTAEPMPQAAPTPVSLLNQDPAEIVRGK